MSSIINLYNRGCESEYIAQVLELPLSEIELEVSKHVLEQIQIMWLETDRSQAVIASFCRVSPSYVYRVVSECFTVEQRIAKKSKVQRRVQTEERVAPPSWYTGPGRSVPLKIIEYCEAVGLTELPPGMSVVCLPGGAFALMTREEAKLLAEARTVILGRGEACRQSQEDYEAQLEEPNEDQS